MRSPARARGRARRPSRAARRRGRGTRCGGVRARVGSLASESSTSRMTSIRDVPLLDERRVPRRKQPAVERGDFEIAGLAARVREARDRLERLPQARSRACLAGSLSRRSSLERRRSEAARPSAPRSCRRRDRSSFQIGTSARASANSRNRMRYTIVSACSNATARSAAVRGFLASAVVKRGQRRQHAVAKRSADARRMRVGFGEHGRGATARPCRRAPARARAAQSAAMPFGPVMSALEIELDRRARPRSRAVDDPERAAVADDAHARLRGQPAPHGVAPGVRRRLRPGNDEQHAVLAAAARSARPQPVRRGPIVAEQLQQRDDRDVEDGARARRRPERARRPAATSARGAARTPPRRARSIAGSTRSSRYACEISPPPNPAITAGAPATPRSARVAMPRPTSAR